MEVLWKGRVWKAPLSVASPEHAWGNGSSGWKAASVSHSAFTVTRGICPPLLCLQQMCCFILSKLFSLVEAGWERGCPPIFRGLFYLFFFFLSFWGTIREQRESVKEREHLSLNQTQTPLMFSAPANCLTAHSFIHSEPMAYWVTWKHACLVLI